MRDAPGPAAPMWSPANVSAQVPLGAQKGPGGGKIAGCARVAYEKA
jgi:hypothetical protein